MGEGTGAASLVHDLGMGILVSERGPKSLAGVPQWSSVAAAVWGVEPRPHSAVKFGPRAACPTLPGYLGEQRAKHVL